MKKYSIMVRENGNSHERELAQVDENPLGVVRGARMLTSRQHVGGKIFNLQRYDRVYARDNQTGEKVVE